MKFSLNLAQYYSNVDLKDLGTDEIVTRMGLQLGAIEDVEVFADKYQGIVVAKVVSSEKHPNADKLSLCFIDDGGAVENVERNEAGHVQVVCGAPNVREGILVAWIPPGATVPSTYGKEPFVLEARELRGKVSNGMLASLKELAMGDDHDGILEITKESTDGIDPAPGSAFSKLYGLDDVVIDCENKMFTHRPDCFGNLGIARELAGIFNLRYKSPDWYTQPPQFEDVATIKLDVSNPVSELVPRFCAIALNDVKVGPSPMWMQGFLLRVGIKPINNVVDVTNYIMHLTGQPIHAFDYDKLEKHSNSPSLHPRMAQKGEKIALLNGKTVELDEADMVIATDKQAVALAGVMGGSETEVDENTNTIVIECATFDMYATRRTSMRHGLFTDAVTRFNKGQSPLQNVQVLGRAITYMKEFASAQQASQLYDLASFDASADNLNKVSLSAEFINSLLGTELKADEIKQILENVEFTVTAKGDDLRITAPFWRMDISIAEDIVEEVGRLNGYHKVPVELPARTSKPAVKNTLHGYRQELREALVKAGANEVLTYSFVHGKLLESTGTDPEKWAYHLRNALSPDLQYYRTSLTPSLLVKVRGNLKAQAGSDKNEFALFEIGKVHVKGHNEEAPEDNLPKQMRRISLVVAADEKTAKARNEGSAYYKAKKYLDLITNDQAKYLPLDTNEYPIVSAYQQGRSAVVVVGEQILGVVGEFNASTRKALKLPEYCAGFEADIDFLYQHVRPTSYQPLSSYPSSSQDMTYEVSETVSWGEVDELLRAELAVASAELGYHYQLHGKDIYQPEDSNTKRYSYALELTHINRTLKTTEVNKLLEDIDSVMSEKLDAIRI